ncbi:hypothetical protein [Legionella sp. 227]|uniref:hypothetical protein n=1 Tax=Legionella sp. 227 TaxID=3367288 RepID=UPI00370DB2C1
MIPKIKKCILVINAGSSSVKFQVFAREQTLPLLAQGKVYDLGSKPLFTVTHETHPIQNYADNAVLPADTTPESALRFILHWVEAQNQSWHVNTVAHGDACSVSSWKQ